MMQYKPLCKIKPNTEQLNPYISNTHRWWKRSTICRYFKIIFVSRMLVKHRKFFLSTFLLRF
ncbi:hypothetical protein PUN28_009362 [Cardiocondyla obscurior]|uniref:Uncharacterized protein n=1 Tax=Cardiocondyla obscurior TaxID=286306 RepID=A0AAW2FXE6_9HYME